MTAPTNSTLVDILLIDGRTDQSGMLHRLRALALASASLHEVIDGHQVTIDEYFDADTHIRLETIAQPRSVREVKQLAARLLTEPFPVGRPEWSLHYVEKVARNRSALLIRRSARFDERLLSALRGTPCESAVNQANQRFDASRLLGVAQQMFLQPDPLNALVDRAASVAARVMQEIEPPTAARSTLWARRSHGHEHQDLRINHDLFSREAARLVMDERSLLLTCFAETVSRMHEHAPSNQSLPELQSSVPMSTHDVRPPSPCPRLGCHLPSACTRSMNCSSTYLNPNLHSESSLQSGYLLLSSRCSGTASLTRLTLGACLPNHSAS